MKRLTAALATAALMLGAIAGAGPAAAASAWDFSGGTFTLKDVQGTTATADVIVSRLRISSASATGYVRVNAKVGGVSYVCSTQTFTGTTAKFPPGGMFNACNGWVDFSVDASGTLTVSDSWLLISSIVFSGPGSGSASGKPYPPATTCTATLNGATGADLAISDSGTGATSFTVTVSPAAPGASIPPAMAPGTSSGPVTATIAGLELGTTYTFTVTPVGGSGTAGICTLKTEDKPQPPVGTATFGAVSGTKAAPVQEVSLSAPTPTPPWVLTWTGADGSSVTSPLLQPCGKSASFTPALVRPDVAAPITGASVLVTPPCPVDVPSFVSGTLAGQSVTVNYTLPSPATPGLQIWAQWRPSGSTSPWKDVLIGTPTAGGTAGAGAFTATGLRVPQSVYVRLYSINGPLTSARGANSRIPGETPPLAYPTPVTGSEGGTSARASSPITADTALLSAGGFTFSVAPGFSLPYGLTLDRNTGVVQSDGRPLAAFNGVVTIQLKDMTGRIATAPVTILIAPAPPAPSSFSYVPISASQGDSLFRRPTLGAGFPSPRFFYAPNLCLKAPGVTLGNANGIFQGASAVALKEAIEVKAYNKPGDPCLGPPAGATFVARTTISITIGPARQAFGVSYAQQSVTALVGSAVNDPATINGVTGPTTAFTYAVTAGTIPQGLALDAKTGTISGTASSPTVSLVTITASLGKSSTSTTLSFTILPVPSGANAGLAYPNVASARATVPLAVLPSGMVTGQTFALDAASLRAGMAIDPATGKITWTPTSAQRGVATVTVTVSANGTSTALAPFTITVVEAPATSQSISVPTTAGATAGASTGMTGGSSGASGSGSGANPCLAPDGAIYSDFHGSVGSTLTMAPNTIGMATPISFVVTKGSLPVGVWLDGNAGVISGTPTRSNGGNGAVEITTTWPDGTQRASDFNIGIDDPHHAVNYPNRIIGSIGQATSVTPFPINAVGSKRFELVCGTLPAGMSMNARTGVISGTPTTLDERPMPLRVRMTDAYGWVDASLLLVVNNGVTPWMRYPEFAEIGTGRVVRIVPTVSGFPRVGHYVLIGLLPKGLTLNAKTGVISGRSVIVNHLVYEPTIVAFGPDDQRITTTVPSMTVVKPAVPMKVTARFANRAVPKGTTAVVTKVKHPAYVSLTARVTCKGCTYTFNKKTGRLVVRATKAGSTVKVNIVGQPKTRATRIAYAGHTWTRSWHVHR